MQERRSYDGRHDGAIRDRLDNAVQQRARTATAPVGIFVGNGEIDFLCERREIERPGKIVIGLVMASGHIQN